MRDASRGEKGLCRLLPSVADARRTAATDAPYAESAEAVSPEF